MSEPNWKDLKFGDDCPHDNCDGQIITHNPGGLFNPWYKLCSLQPEDHRTAISLREFDRLNKEYHTQCIEERERVRNQTEPSAS
jgi:hypothetical protein